MKLKLLAIIVVAIAVVAAGAASVIMVEVRRAPEERRGEVVRLSVERGQPFVGVMAGLEEAGVIRESRALRVYAALRHLDRSIKTGTYEFTIGERPVDILQRLVVGDILRVSVTVPEGYMMWEIAGAFQAAGVDSVELLVAIQDEAVRRGRRVTAPSLEGYLFPDTYVVPWSVGVDGVIEIMTSRLDEVFTDSLFARAVEMDMTPHQVLTLASIIEAEARVDSERTQISAVYHNRLRIGMRLEADPTVAYAMGGYRGRLLYRDLELDSPYNTYRNKGLPPGPICSPGEASIRAAVFPDKDTKALYFVAHGDGSHVFSRTLREHQAAVREARRRRDATN